MSTQQTQLPDDGFRRRDMLALIAITGAGGAALATAGCASTQSVPVAPNTRAVEIFAKLAGDTSGRVSLSYMAGAVWGFRPQADDLALADFARRLYGYKSLVARKVRRLSNGDFAIKQQGWTFYTDPISDEVTDTVRNPYTETDVHPYSPPSRPWEIAYRSNGTEYVPGRESDSPLGTSQSAPFDMRVKAIGAHSFINTSQFIRFQPANISWWKLEATLISYACRTADLWDADLTYIPSTWSMNLVAEWQTWMNMHGAPGHILFKGEGAPVASIADAPADYQAALANTYPGQLEEALGW